jgi:hypothetical protein
MKKVLLGLLLFGLFFCACQSQGKQKMSSPNIGRKTTQQPGNRKQQTDSITKVEYLNEIP